MRVTRGGFGLSENFEGLREKRVAGEDGDAFAKDLVFKNEKAVLCGKSCYYKKNAQGKMVV